MRTITFTGYRPSVSLGEPWTRALIQTANSNLGPWTTLDDVEITPVDQDPREPALRNFVTHVAPDSFAWYRIKFQNAGGDEEATTPQVFGDGPELTYAQVSDYYSENGQGLGFEDVRKALRIAEKDIDTIFLGRETDRSTGRKLQPGRMPPYQAEALKDATVEQAKFRITQGEEFFDSVDKEIQGPDYTIKFGKGSRKPVASATRRHLLLGDLIPRGGRARA